ncbi:hypothetical protein FOL47_000727 [Perkinsus chesapeaki]|uniref:Uncharacterized protein n=1 Tax=Perkinsus chesapeaki TaxID=330153 RepID=A0A7J6ML09_PERCH|nr:hypothetical protein FOL47_000727 [Perkinsus chesapeaki]
MTRAVVSKLPPELAKQVLNRIRTTYAALEGGSVCEVSDEGYTDWESLLPLVSDDSVSVSDIIRSVCRLTTSTTMPSPAKSFGSQDRLYQVSEYPSLSDVETRSQPGSSLKELTGADPILCGRSRHKKSYCVFGFNEANHGIDLSTLGGELRVRPYRPKGDIGNKSSPPSLSGSYEGLPTSSMSKN